MKGVLSCLLTLMLALSITPSVFAEETVGSTTNNVDAINGDDTQEGVGTTTDKAYKTEETVGGTTNYVNAIKGNDTPEETVGGTTNNVNAINGDDTPEETETVGGTTIYVDANNGDDAQKGVGTTAEKAYRSIGEAVKAAKSGYTIKLAKGNYSLYEVCGKQGTNNAEYTKNKDLTFIGAGPEETKWGIGAKVPNSQNFGTEYNSDYSFDGRDTKEKKETVTFKNMTLQAASNDYLGFAGTDNTIVEDCVINGKTFYWGYTSATFRNTTFNCPSYDYAIWTYSSPVMTFDNCTFNTTGKVINVYADFGAGKHDITVNFNGCKVYNNSDLTFLSKPVLNINDSNMENYKYAINISGNNVVKGIKTDRISCSRLFGFSGKPGNNTGRTIVNFGNTPVWQDGKMVDARKYHYSGVTADGVTYNNNVKGSNVSLYAEGYKDNVVNTKTSEWKQNADRKIFRTVTIECRYCEYKETFDEYQGKLTYDANGGIGTMSAKIDVAGKIVTVAQNEFTRNDYTFTGWNTQADGKGTAYKPGDNFTLTDNDAVLYAQWSKNAPAQVKVSYDANGGTGTMESITGDVGSKIVIGQNGFAQSGYTFTGWNTQADGMGTAYKPGDNFILTDKDTVLYAQWSKNAPAQVKVSYDANGGTGTMEFIIGDVGSKIVIEQNGFARSGYTFTGWNTQADGKGTAYKAGNSFTLTDKDTVLYAQWSKNSGSAGTGTNGTAKPSAGTGTKGTAKPSAGTGTKGTAKPSAGTGTKGTAKPTDSPKTGDNSNLALWFALLFVSGGAVTATTIYGRKNKRSVK